MIALAEYPQGSNTCESSSEPGMMVSMPIALSRASAEEKEAVENWANSFGSNSIIMIYKKWEMKTEQI